MLGTFSEFLGYVSCVAALSGELVFLSLGVTGTVHFTIPLPEVASLLGWLVLVLVGKLHLVQKSG